MGLRRATKRMQDYCWVRLTVFNDYNGSLLQGDEYKHEYIHGEVKNTKMWSINCHNSETAQRGLMG